MITRLCCSVIGLILGASTVAGEDAHPTNLAGFIKQGMHLGIRSYDDGVGYNIVVFTPQEFAIRRDARVLDFDELAKRYTSVAARRDKWISNAQKSLEPRKQPRLRVLVDSRLLLCTVQHIGSDYILVTYASDERRRKAFATRYISGIRWGDTLAISDYRGQPTWR